MLRCVIIRAAQKVPARGLKPPLRQPSLCVLDSAQHADTARYNYDMASMHDDDAQCAWQLAGVSSMMPALLRSSRHEMLGV